MGPLLGYRWTNFHSGEKAKAMRLQLPTIYNIHLLFFVFKVQGDDGPFSQTRQ